MMRAVVLDALERTVDQARRAADEELDPFDALVRYMHAALDIRRDLRWQIRVNAQNKNGNK